MFILRYEPGLETLTTENTTVSRVQLIHLHPVLYTLIAQFFSYVRFLYWIICISRYHRAFYISRPIILLLQHQRVNSIFMHLLSWLFTILYWTDTAIMSQQAATHTKWSHVTVFVVLCSFVLLLFIVLVTVHCSCYCSLSLFCATLTGGFSCFFLSCKVNARV
jgi:hypothetical protein